MWQLRHEVDLGCLHVSFLHAFRVFVLFLHLFSCHLELRFAFILFCISLELQIQSWGLVSLHLEFVNVLALHSKT
jgi:hypothetical protein